MTDFIAFESLSAVHGTGSAVMPVMEARNRQMMSMPAMRAQGRGPSAGMGIMPSMAAKGAYRPLNYGRATMPFALCAASSGAPVNNINYAFGRVPGTRVVGVARAEVHGSTGVNRMPAMHALGLGHFDGAVLAHGRMPMASVFGYSAPVITHWGMLIQSPGYMYSVGGEPYTVHTDYLVASDALSIFSGMAFAEHVRATGQYSALGTRRAIAEDSLRGTDGMAFALYMALAEAAATIDVAELDVSSILALGDLLVATGEVNSLRAGLVAVTANLHGLDTPTLIAYLQASESFVATDEVSLRAARAISMLEELLAQDAASALRLGMIVQQNDELHGLDEYFALRDALMALDDTAYVFGKLTFSGMEYTIYAMTVEGAAVSEYGGWDMDSFAVIDGETYGAGESGLYKLAGDDDDGEPIAASVRTGLSNMGTQLAKAVPDVYIGYNSSGALLCKVITTKHGQKKENWYELSPVARATDTGNRFSISKGLHSQYWGFEFTNIDGADFELDFVQAWRMVLNRRK